MDIDAARKAKAINDNCCCCGKLGHWSKDCELWFDVHYMTADKMSALMENQLTALDVVHSEPEEEVFTPRSRILCPAASEPCAPTFLVVIIFQSFQYTMFPIPLKVL